jgi:hypothetical protein
MVKHDDGIIRRYAAHGSTINVANGTRVEKGQIIGSIGRRHLHYEEIPPTINGRPNPIYEAASRGERVSTSGQRGTRDPRLLPRGAQVTGGQPLSGGQQPTTQVAGTPMVSSGVTPPAEPGPDVSRSLYDKLAQQEADVRAVRKLREIREAMDKSDDTTTTERNAFIEKARRQRLERGTFTRRPLDIDRSEMDQAQGRAFFHHRVRGTGKIDVTVNKGQESVAQKGPFKKVSWHRHQQMTEASHGPPAPHDATGGGVIESPA